MSHVAARSFVLPQCANGRVISASAPGDYICVGQPLSAGGRNKARHTRRRRTRHTGPPTPAPHNWHTGPCGKRSEDALKGVRDDGVAQSSVHRPAQSAVSTESPELRHVSRLRHLSRCSALSTVGLQSPFASPRGAPRGTAGPSSSYPRGMSRRGRKRGRQDQAAGAHTSEQRHSRWSGRAKRNDWVVRCPMKVCEAEMHT